MVKKRLPFRKIFLLLFLGIQLIIPISGQEEICGELEVHKQKWIGLNDGEPQKAKQLGQSESSKDLRECLHRCCAISNCSAVSFAGFLGQSASNCSLFHCLNGDDCPFVDALPEAATVGVLTVRLKRPNTVDETTTTQTSTPTLPSSSTAAMPPFSTQLSTKQTMEQQSEQNNKISKEEEDDDQLNKTWPIIEDEIEDKIETTKVENGQGQLLPKSKEADLSEEELIEARANATKEKEMSGPNGHRHSLLDLGSWDQRFPLNPEHTPVWAIGLAIVVTVVSLVLLMAFLVSILCYRRYRSRMRSTEISGPKKMPTLHAFNPS